MRMRNFSFTAHAYAQTSTVPVPAMALRRQVLLNGITGVQQGRQTRYSFCNAPNSPGEAYYNPDAPSGLQEHRGWTASSSEETDDDELLLQAVPSQRRCCCWRELMCILLWIIIASAIPATVVLNFKHQTHNVSYLGYGGDSIELLTVDGFWYEDLIVSQVVEASDQEHKIQLYLPLCSELDIHEKSGHFLSPYHCHSYPTRYLGVREFLHLLTGSKVTYSFCMRSNETQDVTEAEFYVFDDHSKYLDFVNGAGSGRKTSIHRYRMRVGTASEPIACTQFTFTAKKSSYYFMTGSSKAGVTYQYSVTTRIKYLDFKDYHENKSCSALTAKNPCEISVGEQFLSKSEKYCLLAHIIPHHNKHQQLSRTTHVRVYTVKRGEVVAIPIMVVVVGVAGLLVVMMTYCCCCCKKCCKRRSQGRGYTLINV